MSCVIFTLFSSFGFGLEWVGFRLRLGYVGLGWVELLAVVKRVRG